MSAERPILFSAPMVKALLAGTKTQTRRIVKPQPVDLDDLDDDAVGQTFVHRGELRTPLLYGSAWVPCPYGRTGEQLWVKETFAPCTARIRAGHFHYRADGAVGHRVSTNGGDSWWTQTGHTLGLSAKDLQGVWVAPPKRWKPSIFMTRAASRITLEVTAVRVERLQAITATDAIAEGIERGPEPSAGMKVSAGWKDYSRPNLESVGGPVSSYRSLWDSINGAGSWAANPWVWVVEFKRVTP